MNNVSFYYVLVWILFFILIYSPFNQMLLFKNWENIWRDCGNTINLVSLMFFLPRLTIDRTEFLLATAFSLSKYGFIYFLHNEQDVRRGQCLRRVVLVWYLSLFFSYTGYLRLKNLPFMVYIEEDNKPDVQMYNLFSFSIYNSKCIYRQN